jgi:hypothetical protein
MELPELFVLSDDFRTVVAALQSLIPVFIVDVGE